MVEKVPGIRDRERDGWLRVAAAVVGVALIVLGIAMGMAQKASADVPAEPAPKIVGPQPGQVIVVYGETDREAGFPNWGYENEPLLEPPGFGDECIDLGGCPVFKLAPPAPVMVPVSYGATDRQSGLPEAGFELEPGVPTANEIAGLGFIGDSDY